MPENIPDFVQTINNLKESGDLDKIVGWMETDTPVWIKRRDGSWQWGKIIAISTDGLSAHVTWMDPVKGKEVGKSVRTTDLLDWQKEAPSGQKL